MADHQKEIDEFGNNDDFWLFGYGYGDALRLMLALLITCRSLIWKPPPHYGKHHKRVPGYIEGYVRRFWQVRY
jgi:cation transport protein ChaC